MESEIKEALRKRALGYKVTEETKEYALVKDSEGNEEEKEVKRKETTKHIAPDLTAIKMLLELESDKTEPLTEEEMKKEKMRLIKELIEFEMKNKKDGQVSFFD
ncbi:MAG: hypothetical protein FWE22_00165 [Firmicutes bacterium]|nr:hypothetical protein [Bacillota bacterium]